MRPPIVVSEHGSVSIFRDLESLLRFVEPIDVANGEYVAYDRDGRLIHLTSEKIIRKRFFGLLHDESYTPVTLTPESGEAAHSQELKSLLVDTLRVIDPVLAESQRDAPLALVLETAAARLGYTT